MAQQRGLLISEKFLKQNSEIDSNVDVNLLRPTIWYCQKEFIEKSLGTVFYNSLITKVIANTLSGDDLNLVNNYLADALLMWVRSEVQVPMTFKYKNKSVGKNTDPNQQPVDLTEHEYLRNYYRMKAEYFTKRMEDFLCFNSALYPLWLDCSDGGVDARTTKPQTSLSL
jgi:hypothetical protein